MQQTVVVVAETKEQADADVAWDLVTTLLVSGLSYSSCVVADAAMAEVDADAAMIACGSSSCYSSVVASAAIAEVDAVAVATTVATKM